MAVLILFFKFMFLRDKQHAHLAQSVEHFLGKEEVTGSIPVMSTNSLRFALRIGSVIHLNPSGNRNVQG